MSVIAVNENDVKLVKSGHGATKWLVGSQQERVESGDDDSPLGTGYQHPGAQPSVS
jgi:hypothetical protein